jgi:pyrroline-5-carboxylate reductase
LDYRCTYNELIENGTLNTSQLAKDERIIYFQKKNEIRARFYEQFEKEHPDELIRDYYVWLYVFKPTQKEQDDFEEVLNKLTEPLLKQHNFNERIKKLR